MKLEIIKTNNGYMVEHTQGEELGEYVCDTNGDNLFDTYAEAEDLMHTHLMRLRGRSLRSQKVRLCALRSFCVSY